MNIIIYQIVGKIIDFFSKDIDYIKGGKNERLDDMGM